MAEHCKHFKQSQMLTALKTFDDFQLQSSIKYCSDNISHLFIEQFTAGTQQFKTLNTVTGNAHFAVVSPFIHFVCRYLKT